jgi:hypothetical protein
MIKVVPAKTLPRTAAKGNLNIRYALPALHRFIRRRAVEQEFAKDLEAMYASIPVEEVFASVLDVPTSEPETKSTDMSNSGRGPAQALVGVAAAA